MKHLKIYLEKITYHCPLHFKCFNSLEKNSSLRNYVAIDFSINRASTFRFQMLVHPQPDFRSKQYCQSLLLLL